MPSQIQFGNIGIVLRSPRFPENIGASARAMCNMGLKRLIVVAPENFDLIKINRMATHAASVVIDQLVIFDTLEDALAPFNYIVGTTARMGKHRKSIFTPPQMAADLVPIAANNQVAILFGPEDRGLTNADARLCHRLVNIPTDAFSSLNLAQAVMILCYEIYQTVAHKPLDHYSPRLANRHELEGMYGHLKDILLRIGFLNPENPEYWMNNFRDFFNRLPLRAREVKLIRGICRQMDWYGEKRYRDGSQLPLNHRDSKK